MIENQNDYDLLVTLVSKDPIAIDNKGNSFQSQNFAGVNEISTCAPNTGSFASDVKTCLDPDDKRGFNGRSLYDPLGRRRGSPHDEPRFSPGDDHNIGDAVSFSAVIAVRKAPSEADLGKAQKPALPPATIVTVGVALAPLVKG